MKELSTLCYIHEQTSYPEDYKGNFGYEVTEKGGRFYVTFDAILQSFGIINRNGRMYNAENIMNLINSDEYITDQLSKNSWMGEIDHPAAEIEGQSLTVQRISIPDLKKTSHYVRSPRLVGNLLEAKVQTDSSNEHGMNMAIKIVDGKITPAFSARVFGSLTRNTGKPVVDVKRLICYDWVLFQSHPEAVAKLSHPLQEATNMIEKATNSKIVLFEELAKMAANNSKDVAILCEAFNLTEDAVIGMTSDGGSVILQENKNTYSQPISDVFLRNKTSRIMNDWLNS